MKKFLITLALMLTAGIGLSRADLATDSWAVGLGLSYPGYYSANIDPLNSGYGAYLSIQRNFSEHVGLRLKGSYSHLEGQWTNASLNLVTERTNLIAGDLDMLYYFVPCEPVSPYAFAGIGGLYKSITNAQMAVPANSNFGDEVNLGVGAEFKLIPDLSLATELCYHATNNSQLDGTIVPAEFSGHDAYLAFSAGVNYLFGKCGASKQCECGQGTKEEAAYNTLVVDRYIMEVAKDKLVLVGVNFAFDKSDILPESYPVLDKAVKLLTDKPGIKVQIAGYTDYIGSDAYNQELSVQRATTIKDYLVSKGIAADRLSTVGYGELNPVDNNKTSEGREMNRRIVFRIIK
jgi:outer membrane protein OmpA-like peptidoglycan-associated protein